MLLFSHISRRFLRLGMLGTGAALLVACARTKAAQPKDNLEPPALSSDSGTADTPLPTTLTPSGAASGAACGPQNCRKFASPEAAFAFVLARKPAILGLGEAHAQKGTEHIASATERTADSLLPLLAGKSKRLVIELLLPRQDCPSTTAKIQQAQKPVTEPQAKSNPDQFMALGFAAKKLGIMPEALTPTCEEYKRVLSQQGQDIQEMLTLIAAKSKTKVEAELARQTAGDVIVTYGGALHNDLYPSAERAAWSFGPALDASSHAQYVELDLIVPEYIKATEAWTSLAWYADYAAIQQPAGATLLFEPKPRSFVLIFPPAVASKTQPTQTPPPR